MVADAGRLAERSVHRELVPLLPEDSEALLTRLCARLAHDALFPSAE